jgi:hypothetical protein
MNPPTTGHAKLIQKVIDEAKTGRSDHVVFLSQKQKAPTDPLDWAYKRKLAQAMFPGVNISNDATIKTPYQALEELGKTYDHVTMVVGDDRAQDFLSGMSKYAPEFGIETFDVVSSGARDPDSDGVAGVSASKARQFALDGDYENFSKSLSSKLSDNIKQDVYEKIRTASGLEEDADNKNAEEYRRKGLRGEFAYSGWG